MLSTRLSVIKHDDCRHFSSWRSVGCCHVGLTLQDTACEPWRQRTDFSSNHRQRGGVWGCPRGAWARSTRCLVEPLQSPCAFASAAFCLAVRAHWPWCSARQSRCYSGAHAGIYEMYGCSSSFARRPLQRWARNLIQPQPSCSACIVRGNNKFALWSSRTSARIIGLGSQS